MPSPCHFENLIRHLARGAIGIQANKARNAPHPLALVGGVAAACRWISRSLASVSRERRDFLEPEAWRAVCEIGPREGAPHLVLDSGGEHRLACAPRCGVRARPRAARARRQRRMARVAHSRGAPPPERASGRPRRARARGRRGACRWDGRRPRPRGRAPRAARARAPPPRPRRSVPAVRSPGAGAGGRSRSASAARRYRPVPPTTTGVLPAARISSIAACAGASYSPTEALWSSSQMPTSRVARSGWFVRMGRPR